MSDFPTVAALKAEADGLLLPRFAEAEALLLGQIAVERAQGQGVVIDVRTPDRVLFHAALPGSAPLHDRAVAGRRSAQP